MQRDCSQVKRRAIRFRWVQRIIIVLMKIQAVLHCGKPQTPVLVRRHVREVKRNLRVTAMDILVNLGSAGGDISDRLSSKQCTLLGFTDADQGGLLVFLFNGQMKQEMFIVWPR